LQRPGVLLGRWGTSIAVHDHCVDGGGVTGAQQHVDRFSDQIGPGAAQGCRTLVERRQTGIVELDEDLTASRTILWHIILRSSPRASYEAKR
jgi:hypothetical protein